MPLTPRLGLPIPLGTDPATVPTDLNEFATALESGTYAEGLTVDRPVAEKKGRLYRATDTGIWWGDTGTGWAQVGGPHAARHAWNGSDPLPAGPSAQLRRVSAMPVVSVPSGFAADVVWRNDGAQAYMVAGDATGIHLPTGGMWLFSARLDVNFAGTASLSWPVLEVTGQAQFSPGNSPGIMVMAATYAPVRVTLTLFNESPFAGTVGWNTVLNVVRVN